MTHFNENQFIPRVTHPWNDNGIKALVVFYDSMICLSSLPLARSLILLIPASLVNIQLTRHINVLNGFMNNIDLCTTHSPLCPTSRIPSGLFMDPL
jgi:hypothetical protein